MKRVVFGETHGKMEYLYPKLRSLYKDFDEIIIAGEEGFGFPGETDRIISNYGNSITSRPYIRFIRGNHSNIDACREFSYQGLSFIEDGTIEDGILYIGGAESIDRHHRISGYDWWHTEEINDEDFQKIVESVEIEKENIHTVISHDAPRGVQEFILPSRKEVIKTRTDFYLEEIRKIINPYIDRWIFGHYHINKTFVFEGVNYIALKAESTQGFIL